MRQLKDAIAGGIGRRMEQGGMKFDPNVLSRMKERHFVVMVKKVARWMV